MGSPRGARYGGRKGLPAVGKKRLPFCDVDGSLHKLFHQKEEREKGDCLENGLLRE